MLSEICQKLRNMQRNNIGTGNGGQKQRLKVSPAPECFLLIV